MQITEKLRKEILASIPKLPLKVADQVAEKCGVHRDTIYRLYRKLKTNEQVEITDTVIALGEAAITHRKELMDRHKRAIELQRQLSGVN